MSLNVFEAFSGIGAQKKAIDFINKEHGLDYKVVATSDWDIWANISYNAIHYDNDLNVSNGVSILDMKKYLKKFVHSSNSKTPISEKLFDRLSDEVIRSLYSSYKNSNNLGSILNVNGIDLLAKVPNDEKINMIIYSFPCQDLSSAGKNRGMGINENTRSGLLWQIDRILNDLNDLGKLPEFLLLENVLNMLSPRHRDDYYSWVDNLKRFGYHTKEFVLNAKEFGLPQNRTRVYALSVLNKKNFKTIIKLKNDFEQQKNKTTLSEKFLKIDYTNETYRLEAIDAIPNWTNSRKEMLERNPILHSSNKFNKYTRTITTKQDRNPNAGIIDLTGTELEESNPVLYKTKSNYRFITPRETFLLMGFSEKDFERVKENSFLKNDILYRQAGNSIAVNVLEHIFTNIYKECWEPLQIKRTKNDYSFGSRELLEQFQRNVRGRICLRKKLISHF